MTTIPPPNHRRSQPGHQRTSIAGLSSPAPRRPAPSDQRRRSGTQYRREPGPAGEQVGPSFAVGDDSSGRRILSQAAEIRIDVSHVIVDADRHTAAYLAVLDETGNMMTSIDDMAISQEVLTPQLLLPASQPLPQCTDDRTRRQPVAGRTQHRLWPSSQVSGCRYAPIRPPPHWRRGCVPIPAGSVPDHLPTAPEAEACCGVHVQGRRSALTAAKKLW